MHYYESTEGRIDGIDIADEAIDSGPAGTSASGGGYRLGDDTTPSQPAPVAAPSSSRGASQPRKSKKKFASLSDLQGESSSHDHDDDSDKDPQEYFAGGDKSGLAVQDPNGGHNQHIQRLLDTARR